MAIFFNFRSSDGKVSNPFAVGRPGTGIDRVFAVEQTIRLSAAICRHQKNLIAFPGCVARGKGQLLSIPGPDRMSVNASSCHAPLSIEPQDTAAYKRSFDHYASGSTERVQHQAAFYRVNWVK
jgi:hypothetical protein